MMHGVSLLFPPRQTLNKQTTHKFVLSPSLRDPSNREVIILARNWFREMKCSRKFIWYYHRWWHHAIPFTATTLQRGQPKPFAVIPGTLWNDSWMATCLLPINEPTKNISLPCLPACRVRGSCMKASSAHPHMPLHETRRSCNLILASYKPTLVPYPTLPYSDYWHGYPLRVQIIFKRSTSIEEVDRNRDRYQISSYAPGAKKV